MIKKFDVVIASSNPGKIREFQACLRAIPNINLIPQAHFKNITPIAETKSTFVENAIDKARHVSSITGCAAIADDTGLCVRALHGAPGIYSARFAGEPHSADANIEKLLHELKNIPEEKRDAYFYCVIVLMRESQDPIPIICEGMWRGRILSAPRGDQGFGYDAVFYDEVAKQSAAELSLQHKNKISHRGQALACLQRQLLQEMEINSNYSR